MIHKPFNWESKVVQFIELLIDLGLVVAGTATVLYLSGELDALTIENTFYFFRDLIWTNALQLVTILIFFRVYKTSITKHTFGQVMPKVVLALIMTEMLLVFISIFIPGYTFSRLLFIYSLFFEVMYIAIFKFAFYQVYKRVNIKTAIIIGEKDEANSLATKLLLNHKYIKIKYIIYEHIDIENQVDLMFKYIDRVDLVYMTPNLYSKKKNAIIQYCIDKNKNFYMVPQIFEIAIKNANITQVGDILAYEVNGLEMSFENKLAKRLFDIIISVVGVILTAPIMLLFAILIKAYDKGPVFFKQERLTIHNKPFTLIKFRTMIVDAEKHTGPVLATENDPRITKIGRFMRKTRIDELPQFFNILKGDMSIVGPRPERQYFVDQFLEENPTYKYRMLVKAGVTGLAQALGKYNTNFEDKLRFDLYYIRNYSLFHDFQILLHTLRAVFDKESTEGIDEESTLKDVLEFHHLFTIESKDEPSLVRVIEK